MLARPPRGLHGESRGGGGAEVTRAGSGSGAAPRLITRRLLRAWPLPQPEAGGDKEERGRVLVVGGAAEMPGAVILAATAALRAGAGKLRIATAAGIAPAIAVAVPEARVFRLPETDAGAVTAAAAPIVIRRVREVDAVVIGPGMVDDEAVAALVRELLEALGSDGPVIVLDAAAIGALALDRGVPAAIAGRVILTPHAGEMASLLGLEKQEVERRRSACARRAAGMLNAVVALKGQETVIAAPDGRAFCNRAGNVGLATSGSGDTLAGVIVGLAARGAEPLQAAVWGVSVHARAGDRLSRRVGPLGFLARELLAELPRILAELDPHADDRG